MLYEQREADEISELKFFPPRYSEVTLYHLQGVYTHLNIRDDHLNMLNIGDLQGSLWVLGEEARGIGQSRFMPGSKSVTREHTGSKTAQTTPQESLLLVFCLTLIGPLCLRKNNPFHLHSLCRGLEWTSFH